MSIVMLLTTSCGTTKNKDISMNETNTIPVENLDGNEIDPDMMVFSDAQKALINNNNAFALRLFGQVSGMQSSVVSPMSVTYLMAMLANGADGKTKAEIMNLIGAKDFDLAEMNDFYAWLINRGKKADKQTKLSIANYIALNKKFQLKPAFAKAVSGKYNAGVDALDFSAGSTLGKINGWCKKNTDGMIPEIISEVDASAVAYIMNAIYFNGTWTDKFDKNQTEKGQFFGYTRDMKYVDYMHRNGKYLYIDNDTYAAVSLPYGNSSYSMTVLLPNEDKSLAEMIAKLNTETLASLPRNMEKCQVDIRLPRFTTELSLSLNTIISKLGAPTMFDANKADFSKFASGNVAISKMLQKAKIEVSEEGTRAAAVTAGIMAMSMARPDQVRRVNFHCERPFAYIITDNYTGTILFMGQYTGK